MRCAVQNCNNNNERKKAEWRFFSFPKDEKIKQKWITFCRRETGFKVNSACICNAHFTPDDFDRNLRYEMGFCKINPTILRKNSIPTVYPTANPLGEAAQSKKISKSNQLKSCQAKEKETFNELKNLRSKVRALEHAERNYIYEIEKLKACLKKSELQRNNMEARLQCLFTKGQIKKLKNGSKRQQWKVEDISKSITLYTTSAKAYRLLRRNHFPLPGIRTLQRWATKIDFSPANIEPVAKIWLQPKIQESTMDEKIEVEVVVEDEQEVEEKEDEEEMVDEEGEEEVEYIVEKVEEMEEEEESAQYEYAENVLS